MSACAAETDEMMTKAASPVLLAAGLEERLRRLERIHGAEHVEPKILLPGSGIAALRHGAGIGEQHVDTAKFARDAGDP